MVAPKCAGQKITAVRYSTVTFLLMLMLKILSFSLFVAGSSKFVGNQL